MAQSILDMFPDCINEYGLLGCGLYSAAIIGLLILATWHIRTPVRFTRNGGMRFLRIGRLQMSWCICKAPLAR